MDRLIKLSKKLETNIKDLIQGEKTVNEEFADLVSYKVSKTLKENDRAHKVTQEAIKLANKQIQHKLDKANKGIKMIWKHQQDKLSNLATQQKDLTETLHSTNLKLHRDLKPREFTSPREYLLNTPESINSKHGPRRSSGSRGNYGWTPQSNDRPVQMSRQRSRDMSPTLRDSSRHLEDYIPLKRRQDYSPDRMPDQVDKFDDFYVNRLKMEGARNDRNRPM